MDPAAAPPGCLLALVSLASPMAADVSTPLGDCPAALAARYVLDTVLDGLAASPLPLDLHVGVFGYRAGPDGLQFEWLLPPPEPEWALKSFAELAALEHAPRAEGQPRKWIVPAKTGGDPAPGEALLRAHRVLAWWAASNPHGRPPILIHCATADGFDHRAATALRAISAISVAVGPARVHEWTFVPGVETGFPTDAVWNLLFADAEPVALAGSDRPAFTVERSFWRQKFGNEFGMWEDAFAVGECGTVAAVADGASDGIFCRNWSNRLAARFAADRPDLSSRAAVAKWIAAARIDWHAAINYTGLRSTQRSKVNDTGASATLLGLEIGPSDAEGERPWRATSFGDACLFWVRDPQTWLAFPVLDAANLTSHPVLLRTKLGLTAPTAGFATGRCRAGDLFLLATDAVAGKLLKDAASGPVDWERYAAMSPDEWAAELDELRAAGKVVNDDWTLLVLRVITEEHRTDGAAVIISGDSDERTA